MSSYCQNKNVAYREIKGEAVLIDPREGEVFVLNGVGSRVWALLRETQALDAMAEAIAEEFEEPREQVRADISQFLGELEQRGLVEVSSP